MSGGGEVDPDLVRATGLDPDIGEEGVLANLDDFDPAPRFLAVRIGCVNRAEDRVRYGADR